MRASVKEKPSDSAPSSLYTPPTTSINISPPSTSASYTGSVPAMTSSPNCSRVLRTHSTPSLSAVSKLRAKGDQGAHIPLPLFRQIPMLLLQQFHLAQQSGFSFSSEIIPLLNDVANELLHGGFIYSFIKNSFIFHFKSDEVVCQH